jgi:hypothetical protein
VRFASGVSVLGILAVLALPRALPAQEPAEPHSDEELRALVVAAGDSKANDGADLVTVFKRTRVEVEESGLSHITDRQLLKCLTEKGAARLARLRFDYDPASNLVEVRGVRILRQDGTAEEVPLDTAVDLPQPQGGIYWGRDPELHEGLPHRLPG